ncbi:MAG: Na+/H+ antiporter NhaA [Coriobacteriales bacterium]|nr:Na+/H+ antiporter NhaA [Coriobacteriales bacterium]
MRRFIFDEPAVIRRLEQRSTFEGVTSNGTIAAAAMVFAAILAVVVANSPIHHLVTEVLEFRIGFEIGPITAGMPIEAFINDGLMAVFFFLVGIELKYEMTVGQLRRPRQAALPMLAAVGGVAVPALIFLFFNHNGTESGWAIPIATDIAFALGVMSLLGNRIAPETKVFFQTLAIADDILAIVVLAACYGQTPNISWCAASVGALLVLAMLAGAKVYTLKPYMIVGVVLWFCLLMSGIHATLAGVMVAFFLPAQSDVRLTSLHDWLDGWATELDDRYDDESHVLGQHDFTDDARIVERVMHHVTPPLLRAERYIAVFVNFFVLPLFAFANAQVRLVGVNIADIVGNSVTQGAFFGAVLGKPIGIILVTVLLVRIGFAKLPRNMDWMQVVAVGIMGGLGFTMSILISGLAYTDVGLVMAAKCAILAGSVVASLLGIAYVHIAEAARGARRHERT